MKKKVDNFVAYIEQDEDGVFVRSVPSLPSCYTEGSTFEEVTKNLREVIKLCFRNSIVKSPMKFVGIQNLEVAHG